MDGQGSGWTAAQARAAFAAAREATLDDLAPVGSIVVVAPHPDDETLGCGGLIAAASAAGRRVVVAVMTDGAASHPGSPLFDAAARAALRTAELEGAVEALAPGGAQIVAFGASDGGLNAQISEAARWLRAVVERASPATLFVTWNADHHPDHKAAFAVAEAAATLTGSALWAYPVWSLILPDDAPVGSPRRAVRLAVSVHRNRKARAIARHASQLDPDVMADPTGFLLRPQDVARHLAEHEVFLAIRDAG